MPLARRAVQGRPLVKLPFSRLPPLRRLRTLGWALLCPDARSSPLLPADVTLRTIDRYPRGRYAGGGDPLRRGVMWVGVKGEVVGVEQQMQHVHVAVAARVVQRVTALHDTKWRDWM